MPYYETAYPSLLSGISQQLPQSRQPGQLTDQLNMVSDLVRGLCRRPGATLLAPLPNSNANHQYILTKVGGIDTLLAFDPANPSDPLEAFNSRTAAGITVNYTSDALDWLSELGPTSRIANTTVGDDAILVCPDILPGLAAVSSSVDSSKAGYFYVTSGAYNQEYKITVKDLTGVTSYSASYTTPDGTSGAHAAQSSPEYIAGQLATAIDAALPASYSVYTDGAYVFLVSTTQETEVLSDTSAIYIQVSNKSQVREANLLPARLPTQANGYTVRIGNSTVALHFRYDASRRAWLEDAEEDARVSITGLGLRLTYSGGIITVARLDSKTRAAGDATSNPLLAINSGITGVAAFQGRLVLFADQYVCMSAVGDPTTWFRTSVTGLLDSDPIEIALTTAYPSPYKSGVIFNGNLLVLADSHQVQVPGDIAITPSNATLALVGNWGIRAEYSAFPLGRSLMMPTNSASGFVGFVEALPPENLEAMLKATDITSHVPTLIQGSLAYAAASHTADTVVCGVTGPGDASNFIYVHQYMWADLQKVHSAWHRWEFIHPIKFAYFIEDVLYIVAQYSSVRSLSTINMRRGYKPPHYLDFAKEGTVSTVTVGGVPTSVITSFDVTDMYTGSALDQLRAYKLAGSEGVNLGEVPDIVLAPVKLRFKVSGQAGDTYVVGFPYRSEFSPTPPVIKDRSGNFLASQHIPLVRFIAQLKDTGYCQVRVNDRVYDTREFDAPIVPHSALQTLGDTPLINTGTVTIPCRTEARDTIMRMWTNDYYDLNVTTLEYGFKLNPKFRRA